MLRRTPSLFNSLANSLDPTSQLHCLNSIPIKKQNQTKPLLNLHSSWICPVLKREGASQLALLVKNLSVSAGNIRDLGSILGVRRIPWRRTWQPTPVSLPGESRGQRSLAGYSPQCGRVGHDGISHTEMLLGLWWGWEDIGTHSPIQVRSTGFCLQTPRFCCKHYGKWSV